MRNNIPRLKFVDVWPLDSPNLNTLHYKLYKVLRGMVCTRRHANIKSLKKNLTKLIEILPISVVRSLIGAKPNTL